MMTKTTTTDRAWVSVPVAARLLGCGRKAVLRLIRENQLTSRDVPGSFVRVDRGEVEALAEACTKSRAS